MNISHKVCCYVHLAESGDDQAGMVDVLYVSMIRRLGDDIQKLLWFVGTICSQQDICAENNTITAADIHWFYKDGNVSWKTCIKSEKLLQVKQNIMPNHC